MRNAGSAAQSSSSPSSPSSSWSSCSMLRAAAKVLDKVLDKVAVRRRPAAVAIVVDACCQLHCCPLFRRATPGHRDHPKVAGASRSRPLPRRTGTVRNPSADAHLDPPRSRCTVARLCRDCGVRIPSHRGKGKRWKHMRPPPESSPWLPVLAGWVVFLFGYGGLVAVTGSLDRHGILKASTLGPVWFALAGLGLLGSLLLIASGTWRGCTRGGPRVGLVRVILFLVVLGVQLLVGLRPRRGKHASLPRIRRPRTVSGRTGGVVMRGRPTRCPTRWRGRREPRCNLPERFPVTALHEFVVMPNHVHGIIAIVGAALAAARPAAQPGGVDDGNLDATIPGFAAVRAGASPAPTLGDSLGACKSLTDRRCRQAFLATRADRRFGCLWQRNYHDHVIAGAIHEFGASTGLVPVGRRLGRAGGAVRLPRPSLRPTATRAVEAWRARFANNPG